jgi:outer membrane protein assembly factor BamA
VTQVPRRLFYGLAFLLLLPVASAQTNLSPEPGSETTAIGEVTFENVAALSEAEQQQIVQKLHQEDPDRVARQTPDALANFVENAVLAVYQDKGYWRAQVSARIRWVRGRDTQRQVDVAISSRNEGAQYWLKGIVWTGATVFPNDELLNLMAIRPFELMSRSKIANGLEAIHRLYVSRGYAAFSVVPEAEFDDAAHSVSLLIKVQEDSPFRFGNLSLEGLDRKVGRALQQEWELMREQPYSPERLRGFFGKFTRQLPAGADPLEYSTSSLDLDNHTVDVFVSFRPAQAEQRE